MWPVKAHLILLKTTNVVVFIIVVYFVFVVVHFFVVVFNVDAAALLVNADHMIFIVVHICSYEAPER